MSVQKDWTHDAAIAIRSLFVDDPFMARDDDMPSDDQIRNVLIEHCPFKPDVARLWMQGRCAHCGGYFKVHSA